MDTSQYRDVGLQALVADFVQVKFVGQFEGTVGKPLRFRSVAHRLLGPGQVSLDREEGAGAGDIHFHHHLAGFEEGLACFFLLATVEERLPFAL